MACSSLCLRPSTSRASESALPFDSLVLLQLRDHSNECSLPCIALQTQKLPICSELFTLVVRCVERSEKNRLLEAVQSTNQPPDIRSQLIVCRMEEVAPAESIHRRTKGHKAHIVIVDYSVNVHGKTRRNAKRDQEQPNKEERIPCECRLPGSYPCQQNRGGKSGGTELPSRCHQRFHSVPSDCNYLLDRTQ